jgi:hypothetical protein
MIHSIDKAKDMARSILPSRWRGAAKSRAHLHRALRRTVSQSLHALERDPSSWDEGVEFGEALEPEVSTFVSRRRGSDKLNHFERWAIARTAALPKVHRLGALASVLPDGLIGQHAMSHLERRRELAPDRDDLRLTWLRRSLFLERGHLAELLRDVLTRPGGVRALHGALKRATRSDGATAIHGEFRPLKGLHDVLPFLDWLESNSSRARLASRHVVDVFCRVLHETGDVEGALRQSMGPAPLPLRTYEYLRWGA